MFITFRLGFVHSFLLKKFARIFFNIFQIKYPAQGINLVYCYCVVLREIYYITQSDPHPTIRYLKGQIFGNIFDFRAHLLIIAIKASKSLL